MLRSVAVNCIFSLNVNQLFKFITDIHQCKYNIIFWNYKMF